MSEFRVAVSREVDGRWIGEIVDIPGVLVYGSTRDEAVNLALSLAARVIAERLANGEPLPEVHI